MDTKALRQKILDLAIRGKLVPQDPNDEPASVLLERIREQKQQMVKDGKLKAKDIKDDSIIDADELPDPIESGEEAIAQLEEAVDLLKSVVRELKALSSEE